MQWPVAARDHDTFCISCHTAVPYALSRSALRKTLGEKIPSTYERALLENIRKRVRLWKEVGPFYSDTGYDHKSNESRGTESVLNFLILATSDAENGKLSDDARSAFDNMWVLQQTTGDAKGAWSWLQFNLQPWEANDSQYYGATLAALSVGTVPEKYRSVPQIQSHLRLLRDYLDRHYAQQSTLNHVYLLWASTKWTGLLDPKRQDSIIREVLDKQKADGGWTLSSLQRRGDLFSLVGVWIRKDGTLLESNCDGYATGFVTFVLQKAGLSRHDAHLQNGLSWLMRNQNKHEGLWPSYSLNKRREPSYASAHFMSDAATAFAVLALTATQ
jgi:squalene-hopene/tetraprenyl-beta-curcumene cyclase